MFGFIAAVAGGFVCTATSRSVKPTLVLAGLVFVLGLLMAIPVLSATDDGPNVRAGDVGNVEAMQNARQPGWVALVNPILGAVGVFVGSKLRRVESG